VSLRQRKNRIAVALARLPQVVETLHTRLISVRELDAGRLLSSTPGQSPYFLRTAAASKVSLRRYGTWGSVANLAGGGIPGIWTPVG
jgi:hypothetical protein